MDEKLQDKSTILYYRLNMAMWLRKFFSQKEYLYYEMNVWRALRVLSRNHLNVPKQGVELTTKLDLSKGGVVIQFSRDRLEKLGCVSDQRLVTPVGELLNNLVDIHTTRLVLLIATNDLAHLMRINPIHYRSYEKALRSLKSHAKIRD